MDAASAERLHFNWVIDDYLAGCSRPGDSGAPLADDLALLAAEGVGAIVSLTEDPIDEAAVRAAGFDYLHLFCRDGHPPANTQMFQLSEYVEAQRRRGRRVVLHCYAGMQRTMTGLAAYLIAAQRLSAADALSIVQANRLGPGRPATARITDTQRIALNEFAEWVRARK